MGYVQIMGYIGAFTVDNSITNSPQDLKTLRWLCKCHMLYTKNKYDATRELL